MVLVLWCDAFVLTGLSNEPRQNQGRELVDRKVVKASPVILLLTVPRRLFCFGSLVILAGRVAQLVGHLTRKSGVLGSIPGLATYFRFSFCFFKKGSCQLLAKVCARSTG